MIMPDFHTTRNNLDPSVREFFSQIRGEIAFSGYVPAMIVGAFLVMLAVTCRKISE